MPRWTSLLAAGVLVAVMVSAAPCGGGTSGLDPRGRLHVPIGEPNSVDTLKTFVEAEGNFSPGVGSYGIYFWVFDEAAGRLVAPTQDGVKCTHGLAPGGVLIPWSQWAAGDVAVRTEVCQVRRESLEGPAQVVAARVTLTHGGKSDGKVRLYVALRGLGAAGFAVKRLAVSSRRDALLVDGHPALVAEDKADQAGAVATDTVGQLALQGRMPKDDSAESGRGDCSGALRFDVTLKPGGSRTFGFVCPVLPGRRAVGHQWDGKSNWAQLDLAKPNPPTGGTPQPEAGMDYYRGLRAAELFTAAQRYWKDMVGRVELVLPDPRWAEAFAAITGHVAMAMNDGAPDVAVVNYNVFNRDGVYAANILQKAGRFDLAERAIDFFLRHPFNGRVYPEADNPGQILWCMGEHWLFTRDRAWLKRVHASMAKIAAMIRYYRTTPGPHWVQMDGLSFGEAVAKDQRRELKPGRCDGRHPEYTEAFDVAGLRAAAELARAAGQEKAAAEYAQLAGQLMAKYDKQFGGRLANGYGSYSVLWPCRLYRPDRGTAHEQFKAVGPQGPGGWRYFALARAHQGLVTGNRAAGHETIRRHLDHPQMRGWYVFDEGGKSGSGGWSHVRTTWKSSVAMPHGWAVAELHLLLRDSLAFECDRRLVLFAGVPEAWFTDKRGMSIVDLPTHFGALSAAWKRTPRGARVALTGRARPHDGFVLRLPASLKAAVTVSGKRVECADGGHVVPAGTRDVDIEFGP